MNIEECHHSTFQNSSVYNSMLSAVNWSMYHYSHQPTQWSRIPEICQSGNTAARIFQYIKYTLLLKVRLVISWTPRIMGISYEIQNWNQMNEWLRFEVLMYEADYVVLLDFNAVNDSQTGTKASETHTVSIFMAKDGESMSFRNAGIFLQVYTALKPRRTASSSNEWFV
jgi:hypothetical protein